MAAKAPSKTLSQLSEIYRSFICTYLPCTNQKKAVNKRLGVQEPVNAASTSCFDCEELWPQPTDHTTSWLAAQQMQHQSLWPLQGTEKVFIWLRCFPSLCSPGLLKSFREIKLLDAAEPVHPYQGTATSSWATSPVLNNCVPWDLYKCRGLSEHSSGLLAPVTEIFHSPKEWEQCRLCWAKHPNGVPANMFQL